MLTPIKVADLIERLAWHAAECNLQDTEIAIALRKRFLTIMLDLNGGNRCKTAEQLRIHRNTLARRMRECGVELHPPKRRRRQEHVNA